MTKDPTRSGARQDSDGASTLDLSGRCVGSSYILVKPIGHGATGTVWRGVDRASGEQVALKLLHESLLRLVGGLLPALWRRGIYKQLAGY